MNNFQDYRIATRAQAGLGIEKIEELNPRAKNAFYYAVNREDQHELVSLEKFKRDVRAMAGTRMARRAVLMVDEFHTKSGLQELHVSVDHNPPGAGN